MQEEQYEIVKIYSFRYRYVLAGMIKQQFATIFRFYLILL